MYPAVYATGAATNGAEYVVYADDTSGATAAANRPGLASGFASAAGAGAAEATITAIRHRKAIYIRVSVQRQIESIEYLRAHSVQNSSSAMNSGLTVLNMLSDCVDWLDTG